MANVLIVDDEEGDRLLMRRLLYDSGHVLYFATNGEEAMKLFLHNPVDVVVTDMQMPRGDGMELIDAILGLSPGARIVAVTGKDPSTLDAARLAGAREVLTKPFTKEQLAAAVASAMRGDASRHDGPDAPGSD